jgi:hypothetical protein
LTKVLVIKPGTLVAADKRKLRNAGVVAVEAEHPEDVRLLSTEGPPMDGDELLFAAVSAINVSSTAKGAFAEEMLNALNRIRAKWDAEQSRESV